MAVIVTSGTATANLYPALIEAGLTGEKLILLTADRPPELIDCGANRAIRQPGMFASHPAQTISLPRPSQDIPARWLVSTIDRRWARCTPAGCILTVRSLNRCMVIWMRPAWSGSSSSATGGRATNPAAPCAAVREREAARLVLLATKTRRRRGGQNERRGREKVAEWAQTLGWPLIGDVLSQTGQPLPCADLWLGNGKAVSELAQAQIVVQLGSSLTGKRVLQWQATCEPDEYWLVDNLPGRLDPAQHRGRRLLSSVERWLELHPAEKRQPWATVIPQLAGQAWQAAVASNEPFGEAQLAQRIRGYLPEQGQLFVGNSPVVRLIDAPRSYRPGIRSTATAAPAASMA